jgi:hypothetical protein
MPALDFEKGGISRIIEFTGMKHCSYFREFVHI